MTDSINLFFGHILHYFFTTEARRAQRKAREQILRVLCVSVVNLVSWKNSTDDRKEDQLMTDQRKLTKRKADREFLD